MRLTDRSKELFEASLKHIPGGVNSPVRAFRAVGGEPFFVDRAKGAHIWDVDGNDYIDYVTSNDGQTDINNKSMVTESQKLLYYSRTTGY